MILLTALNNKVFYLNCDMFEKIEVTPDTVITLSNGKKFVVLETPEEIIKRIIDFRKKYMTSLPEVNYEKE
ncbi:endoflagellar protein [Fervidicella metallireducens AeB]|uniref:Endoflagellar protein n=1 Tax=Fervidicella metallireducens AeB TaxID=1403537 RepID=A0A017RVT8_9CLOT|nr:flagellar FlbD family protein [Fervidicella metallireducens]EYE88802.1 endoflagellar protein [Fervidicella metallireducens AeB]